MRILVTGGAGLIGSHLMHRLIAEGHTVTCLDNLFTGRESNFQDLLDHPNFSFVHHDVTSPIHLSNLDQIYHLACPASPVHYQFDPIMTMKISVMGTLNMLDLALANQARILFASTSEVYGDPLVHPQTETYLGNVNCTGVRACYDEGKRAAETLMFDYHRQHQAHIAVARIFNTYGPWMREDDGRVVSNFIIQSLKNEPLTLYGDGSQTRSFCYVADMVDGLVRLMDSTEMGPINLGNPNEFTILELAQHVKHLTGSSSELIYLPLPSDDPKLRRPDIHRAQSLLGWMPRILLEEGLRLTIEDFSHRLGQSVVNQVA